jgi:hypothetical protein
LMLFLGPDHPKPSLTTMDMAGISRSEVKPLWLTKLNVKDIPLCDPKAGGIIQKAHKIAALLNMGHQWLTIIVHICRPIYDGIRMSPPLKRTRKTNTHAQLRGNNYRGSRKIVDTPLLILDVSERSLPKN